MKIHIESGWFSLLVVLWPVYQASIDAMQGRCFRVRLGRWVWPKRK